MYRVVNTKHSIVTGCDQSADYQCQVNKKYDLVIPHRPKSFYDRLINHEHNFSDIT